MPASRPITGIDLSTGAPYSALAWGDGTNDDTAVIQAALKACGLIKVPAGTYKLTSTLSIPPIDGAGIVGDGAAIKNVQASTTGTVFVANFASGDIITCPQHLTHPTFRGFVLDRSVTPTSGIGLNLSIICDAALIDMYGRSTLSSAFTSVLPAIPVSTTFTPKPTHPTVSRSSGSGSFRSLWPC